MHKMNNTFLLLIFLSQQLLQAQTRPKLIRNRTYPLGIGNTWQYCTYDYLNGQYTWIYGWTEKVIGDTVMSNLKRYSVIKSDKRIVKNIFVSQELNKVYQYINSRDSLLYDYEKRAGDTLLFIPSLIMIRYCKLFQMSGLIIISVKVGMYGLIICILLK